MYALNFFIKQYKFIFIISVILVPKALLAFEIDLREPIPKANEDFNIPKTLHAIWVGPNEMNPQFELNLINTISNFPDFKLHLWTSWGELDNVGFEPEGLDIHRKEELDSILTEFRVDDFTTILDWVNKEISFKAYAGAKDIIQFALLYKYGGMVFDLDVVLNDKIRNLAGISNHGHYSAAFSPCFFASAPRSVFARSGLSFFAMFTHVLAVANFCKDFNLDSYREKFLRTVTTQTTGSIMLFANRLIGLKTLDTNLHKQAINHKCEKCQKDIYPYDVWKLSKTLQNDTSLADYLKFLETPSSISDLDDSEADNKFYKTLRLARFQAFVFIAGGEKFYDCSGQ
jgi:hypothetical protein